MSNLHILFDGPPGPEAGRFVEVENDDGKSIRVGEWKERECGYWELVIPDQDAALTQAAKDIAGLKYEMTESKKLSDATILRLDKRIEQAERELATLRKVLGLLRRSDRCWALLDREVVAAGLDIEALKKEKI